MPEAPLDRLEGWGPGLGGGTLRVTQVSDAHAVEGPSGAFFLVL